MYLCPPSPHNLEQKCTLKMSYSIKIHLCANTSNSCTTKHLHLHLAESALSSMHCPHQHFVLSLLLQTPAHSLLLNMDPCTAGKGEG